MIIIEKIQNQEEINNMLDDQVENLNKESNELLADQIAELNAQADEMLADHFGEVNNMISILED